MKNNSNRKLHVLVVNVPSPISEVISDQASDWSLSHEDRDQIVKSVLRTQAVVLLCQEQIAALSCQIRHLSDVGAGQESIG